MQVTARGAPGIFSSVIGMQRDCSEKAAASVHGRRCLCFASPKHTGRRLLYDQNANSKKMAYGFRALRALLDSTAPTSMSVSLYNSIIVMCCRMFLAPRVGFRDVRLPCIYSGRELRSDNKYIVAHVLARFYRRNEMVSWCTGWIQQ